MKLLTIKLILIFIYLIPSSSSYAIQQLDLKNLIVHKEPKKLEKINFYNIESKTINLDKFKNSLVIINFWATWCAPCKEEMPSLNRLQVNKKVKNLKIYPINISKESLTKVNNFFAELGIDNLEPYFDNPSTLAKTFSLRGIPTSILLNSKGEEFARIIGSINFDDENFINWLKNLN